MAMKEELLWFGSRLTGSIPGPGARLGGRGKGRSWVPPNPLAQRPQAPACAELRTSKVSRAGSRLQASAGSAGPILLGPRVGTGKNTLRCSLEEAMARPHCPPVDTARLAPGWPPGGLWAPGDKASGSASGTPGCPGLLEQRTDSCLSGGTCSFLPPHNGKTPQSINTSGQGSPSPVSLEGGEGGMGHLEFPGRGEGHLTLSCASQGIHPSPCESQGFHGPQWRPKMGPVTGIREQCIRDRVCLEKRVASR